MQERRAITFDNKIPLTWLIGSAGTVLFLLGSVLWNVAGQNSKLDQLVTQADKAERQNIERDAKLDTMIRAGYDAKRETEVLNVRVQALEKERK